MRLFRSYRSRSDDPKITLVQSVLPLSFPQSLEFIPSIVEGPPYS